MKESRILLLLVLVIMMFSSFKFFEGEGDSGHSIDFLNKDTSVYPFDFIDVTNTRGLNPDVTWIRGHAVAWGDINGNGWPDLYVGTFSNAPSKPNMLFFNEEGQFSLSEQRTVRISSRSTGAILVDLDNDGDLDLYLGNMPIETRGLVGSSLFENDGTGHFKDVSENNGACPPAFGGRSATVLDYDGDGLLDILVGEDEKPIYNGSSTHSSRLFKNLGNLQFRDVTREVGIPWGTPGYGVAAADVNNDGWPDIFIAASNSGNKLLINNKDGTFSEAEGANDIFYFKDTTDRKKMTTGIAFGDINHDGKLDVVLGPHFNLPNQNPAPVRLFINMGNDEKGFPVFKEITEKAGLKPLYMKAPHVEIQDFDNDGLMDISTSSLRFKEGKPYPVILKNTGLDEEGIPQFKDYQINDYPTEEDRKIDNVSEFWKKSDRERRTTYGAPGPTGDFNRDGKLDMFIGMWRVGQTSLLLQNNTKGGNWIQVMVEGKKGVNRMGVGSKITIYKAGHLDESDAILGTQDISVGYGYASGHEAMAHFGLGDNETVDVEVMLPHNKGRIIRKEVNANQRIIID